MTKHEEIRIGIISPPDREKVTAELMIGNEQWAELNQERDQLELEIYPRRNGKPWVIDYEDALRALTDAKRRLLGE
jgi:hypothetical protein